MERARAAIVGLAGPVLAEAEAELLRAGRPAGVALFARNVVEPAQLAALAGSVRRLLGPDAVVMIDQEGGRVARLRPPHWRAHPAAARIGALADPAAARAAWITGALIGGECLAAGCDVVAAPVLDLAVPGASNVVGDRAYGADPDRVARLGRAMADGLLASGAQPVGKHAPGHGRALVDSHQALPTLETLDPRELEPFRRNADLPWMMTAHIRYRPWDELPATLSAKVIGGVIRREIEFDGVLVSDDLAMRALSGAPGALARQAVAAGCDLALHCSGRLEDSRSVLDAAPWLAEAAVARLVRASARARASRRALDLPALASERDALLGVGG